MHDRTVRHGLREPGARFGERLTGPERRFTTEAALRARDPQGHRPRPEGA
ncbi:hypothetical protein WDA79_16690 [Streptomyces sp. A475]